MAVFKSWQIEEFRSGLHTFARYALNKTPIYLTRDEFVEAFINPDHVDRLKDVYDLVGAEKPDAFVCSPYDFEPEVAAPISVHFLTTPNVLIPGYAHRTFNRYTPAGIKVANFISERKRMGLLLGDAKDALPWLNEHCGTAKSMSMVFPALTGIMLRSGPKPSADGVGRYEARVNQIIKTKNFGSLPALSKESVKRLQDASALLQALFMAEGATATDAPKDACAIITGASWSPDAWNPEYPSSFVRPHVIYAGDTTSTYV